MSELLKLILELGISPAGAAVVALLITWFFVIFYFLPHIQSADENQKELQDRINELVIHLEQKEAQNDELTDRIEKLTQQIDDITIQLDTNLSQTNKALKNCASLLSVLKEQAEVSGENIDVFISSIARLRKAINNLLLMMMQQSGEDPVKVALQLLDDFDEVDLKKKNFRFKNLKDKEVKP